MSKKLKLATTFMISTLFFSSAYAQQIVTRCQINDASKKQAVPGFSEAIDTIENKEKPGFDMEKTEVLLTEENGKYIAIKIGLSIYMEAFGDEIQSSTEKIDGRETLVIDVTHADSDVFTLGIDKSEKIGIIVHQSINSKTQAEFARFTCNLAK